MYVGRVPVKQKKLNDNTYEVVWEDNTIFEDDLKVIGYNNIRSGICIKLESLKNGSRYEMTFHHFYNLMNKLKDMVVSGKFTFYKSGNSYYISIVE